ncbi:putative tubulin polyglutamylase TTLL2 [Archocentrus centrarchus]|uniref:putative tubulin polyglutamylase TTLL2 n=1 Tax=Archocentrus centrarchus TaxID=63155 RepID=UPI0011E9C2D0|nr:probable tubulin polyglutamylase TTLL2 [Archocentrus centrarchus]
MAASLVFRLHDRGPELVREVLLERGWEEYDKGERGEEDWNLYWRGSPFCNSQYRNLLPWQRLNHHPKTVGITRKDCLARNLKRMKAAFGSALYDFSPTTFILPSEYTRFLAEYNRLRMARGTSAYWIVKPVDLSKGKGIFIFEDIKDLVYDCAVVIQRYISNPLLISSYKFDLRIYVCVKSFRPLTVYIHQEGLVRFATEKYHLSSLHNLYSHLTNTSINKFGPFYKTEKGQVGKGCKWTMSKFRHFLQSQDIKELLLWQRINNIVTLTLLTIAASVPSSPNCVELLGFDILIDAKFKPWLLEVNYSPALTLDCQADVSVKKKLVGDLIDLMNYTSTDGLRDRAYQKCGYKQPFKANHPSAPVLSKLNHQKKRKGNKDSETQTLPLLKAPCQPAKMNKRQFKQCDFVANYQRRLPSVDFAEIHEARCRIFNTSAVKTHTDQKRNLIPGPDSRTNESALNRQSLPPLASRLMDNESLYVSDVTNHDNSETEAERERSGETDVSSSILDTQERGQGVRRGSQRPARIAVERTRGNGQHVPPVRVGDFIRTFPFNVATLKASQHKLDITTVLQEIHRLTARLISGQSDKMKSRGEEEVMADMDADNDFDSLLWGPKDPPLISQCFKST